LLTQLN